MLPEERVKTKSFIKYNKPTDCFGYKENHVTSAETNDKRAKLLKKKAGNIN